MSGNNRIYYRKFPKKLSDNLHDFVQNRDTAHVFRSILHVKKSFSSKRPDSIKVSNQNAIQAFDKK